MQPAMQPDAVDPSAKSPRTSGRQQCSFPLDLLSFREGGLLLLYYSADRGFRAALSPPRGYGWCPSVTSPSSSIVISLTATIWEPPGRISRCLLLDSSNQTIQTADMVPPFCTLPVWSKGTVPMSRPSYLNCQMSIPSHPTRKHFVPC